ncbi:MAG: enoyl-CoA hydratase [Acidimicrobiales bacterium]
MGDPHADRRVHQDPRGGAGRGGDPGGARPARGGQRPGPTHALRAQRRPRPGRARQHDQGDRGGGRRGALLLRPRPARRAKLDEFDTVLQFGDFDAPGQEGYMAQEQEIYLGFCWRWRNIAKPTIASVQGKVIAGGLMLVWPFDIVIASTDARFSDPVVAFGANGVEYFAHPYEVGARKAKQMLFTGEAITAEEAHRLGMVNEVVPREELEQATLAMATKIAAQPSMGLKLAKASVNQALDNMGMYGTLQAAFGLHHLSHSHNGQRFGMLVDPEGADRIKAQARAQK